MNRIFHGDKIKNNHRHQHKYNDFQDQHWNDLSQEEEHRLNQQHGHHCHCAHAQHIQESSSFTSIDRMFFLLPQHGFGHTVRKLSCQLGAGRGNDHICHYLQKIPVFQCRQYQNQKIHHNTVRKAEGNTKHTAIMKMASAHGNKKRFSAPSNKRVAK